MTQDEQTLFMIQGFISKLPEDQQGEIACIKETLKEIVEDNGDSGLLAIALLGAEITANG